ncbi:MAG: glycosyltransferase [Bacteroidales bacterium]|nr:glycosyltransferase [Bacteroidales bacterium]
MKKILVLTNIYPALDMVEENTPVVHYFTREWVKMGYDVRVIYYRANFPRLMMFFFSLFKNRLSSRHGATLRTRYASEKEYELDCVKVKRIPLLKIKPHRAFPKREIDKACTITLDYLQEQGFEPDAIISHWVNPQLEIMDRLKRKYGCTTCYVAHLPPIEFERIYTQEHSQGLIDNIDLIGFRSAYIREEFLGKFKFDRPTFQCYSGIPEKFVPQVPVRRSFDKVENYVFVGTLIKRKFPAEIIPALVKAYKDEPFGMTYIGSGFEATSIKKHAMELNVSRNVHLMGHIPREEVVRKLQESDVFIMISKWEAFGLVYLEAMSQGLITIASRHEGFDGIIEHGKNGFLCEAGNIGELADLVSEIRTMAPEKLQEISRNAMKTAKWLTDRNAAKMYIEEVLA